MPHPDTPTDDDPDLEGWQLIKFLIAGAYNTAFSLAVFAGLYFLLQDLIHYTLIAILTYFIAITNSFLIHRYLVFRSRGNIVHEYLKSYVVYAASFVVNFVLLVLLVELAGLHPILAQAFTIVATVIVSFIGNSRFVFKTRTGR